MSTLDRAEQAHRAQEVAERTGCGLDAAMRLVTAKTPRARQAAEKMIGGMTLDEALAYEQQPDSSPFAAWDRKFRQAFGE